MPDDPKAVLHRYLKSARDVLLWKLEGLSEYDIRRPLVPTGTNLLGLVKHTASCTANYFGPVFGRPFPQEQPWFFDEQNGDMWATADETRDEIVEIYRLAWAHADATIEALPIDAVGRVPHWPDERAEVTLHQIMVHMIAEANRHGGHADIVRELIDGTVGMRTGVDNMAEGDAAWWVDYRDKLERVALEVGGS